ncbi:MAG TPA: ATP-binding protein [Polyangiaceae bacterium]|jgi:CheY-like chemotaxis protein/two-component sensor histidine kinase|nr:ATP-binding protein [Polyangiaceae bacterium]
MRSGAPVSLPPPSGPIRETDLAGALHEVSNALTVVLGWLDVACNRQDPHAMREAVEVARLHARLGHQISRSAIGAEVPERESEQRSARSVLSAAALGVTPQAERRAVRVVIDSAEPGHALVRHAGAALQILTNLLLNAIDFSPEDGEVVVSVSDAGSSVVFSVADEGPGIDPDRVATLLSAPQSTRRGGAGVGLRHSAALARSHGGELRVARANPGAAFELRWPIAEARSSVRPSNQTKSLVRGARVLLVEDDAAVCSLVELALGARGAEVVIAGSRAEFDAALTNAGPFDAALVDLSPLAGQVSVAFDRLQQNCPDIPVILISGVASGVPEEVIDRVTAWVRKPFEMGEVIEVLGSHLAPSSASVARSPR